MHVYTQVGSGKASKSHTGTFPRPTLLPANKRTTAPSPTVLFVDMCTAMCAAMCVGMCIDMRISNPPDAQVIYMSLRMSPYMPLHMLPA